jgi:four helix bundle protein
VESIQIKSFRDLRTWQEAQALAIEVYRITNALPKEELYGLTSQLRRASISVPSNIAEGMGRSSPKDFIRFLMQSRGSIQEILSQLDFIVRVGYCTTKTIEPISRRYEGLNAGINAHIEGLRLRA